MAKTEGAEQTEEDLEDIRKHRGNTDVLEDLTWNTDKLASESNRSTQ